MKSWVYWGNGASSEEVHSVEEIEHGAIDAAFGIIKERFGLVTDTDGAFTLVKDQGNNNWGVIWGDCEEGVMERFKQELKNQPYWYPC